MENKQSSIEWLRSLYENRPAYEECILDEEWEQAKAMHKEEIIKASEAGFDDGNGFIEEMKYKSAEQYYNETFGGNK